MKQKTSKILTLIMALGLFAIPLVGCGTMTSTDENKNGVTNDQVQKDNVTNNEKGAANNTSDEIKRAEKIHDELAKMNTIEKATVLVNDNTAIIGVRPKDVASYTNEMRTSIEEKVKAIDKKITTVKITNEESLYGRIENMYRDMYNGKTMTDVKTEYDRLIKDF